MQYIEDFNFSGHRAIIRVDFNVPLEEKNGKYIVNDFTRINAAIPTIKKIINDGGSAVLMSHLGRPKGEPQEKFSLNHIVDILSEKLGTAVAFAGDCIGDKAYALTSNLKPKEVVLLENLRFYNEETSGDEVFAKKLSNHGDVWVNDAFGTAHRAHASTAVIAKFVDHKVCGYVIESELKNASKVLGSGEKPLVAIMGGAKISDKILIIEKLLDKVDYLIIGGGMSYTFSKALGGNIGDSLLEADKQDLAMSIIEQAKKKGVKLLLPLDIIAASKFDNDAVTQVVKSGKIPDNFMGLDIGPKTIESFSSVIYNCKTILWNGPMGVFEMPNFAKGTSAIAEAVVTATQNGGFSLIGGGDSASAINNLGYGDKVSYVSTGGGALLEYMEGKDLPGVLALE